MCLKGICDNRVCFFCITAALDDLNLLESICILCIIFNAIPEPLNIYDTGFSRLKMANQNICTIRMVLCYPLTGKISKLLIVGSDDSVYQIVVIFRDDIVDVNNLDTLILAVLKDCSGPRGIIRNINQSINSTCDHIVNL